jgi:4-hydroxy-tetrahydrodipicolinate synthase
MLQGTFTALITPFKDGKVDFEAIENLVEWQIQSGINGLVPCASTGEFPALSHQEQKQIIEICVKTNKGRVPIIAGASAINPDTVIELAQQAMHSGADGVMTVVPYYVKPTQEQIHDFYTYIDNFLKVPLLLYNNPSRCSITMSVETIAKLAQKKTIIGIKEADPDITRPTKLLNAISRTDFSILSGNSNSAPAFLASGGHGVISTTSNVDPVRCVALYEAWVKNDMPTFADLRQKLIDLDESLYLEPAPATIKYVLSQRRLCTEEVRRPLKAFGDQYRNRINLLLESFKLSEVNE